MAHQFEYAHDAIAIVGSACRFAGGVQSPSTLWDLLERPRDVLSEIPPSRFNAAKFYHPNALHSGTSNVRHSYLLGEDHREFDAQFFGVKPVEAAAIDPQQRILLETTYEALEAAGIPMEDIRGSDMGVYVGLMIEEYSQILGADMQNIPTYFASGTARNNISNRISYFFDLHGPSMTIDTACSSSLVALHQAVLSLRAGEINSALVAGANLILSPKQYVASSKLKMLSSSGSSRMWDAKADGYGRGDGFGVLVLKSLTRAQADGDAIECIIREAGVNQDGRTKGLTMPSPRAQADLMRNTYKRAGLDLDKPQDRPQFFEAHGTGTPAGDPIEAEAISTVFFGTGGPRFAQPLPVGSAKTVLGHTEGTAGILGVMKVSLALQHATVPPNMLLDDLNPSVKPFCTHLRIPLGPEPWPSTFGHSPRRASVNSFGFGGTNAHAILESYETQPTHINPVDNDDVLPPVPFNFSAASESSLRRTLAAYASYIRKNPEVSLMDLAWTLSFRRSKLPVMISIAAPGVYELAEKIEEASNGSGPYKMATAMVTPEALDTDRRLLGIFTGQGAQWAAMGRHLLEASPLVAECFEKLQTALDEMPRYAPTWSLREELVRDVATSRIGEGAFSQPLCAAIQIALVQLLNTAGVTFTAVVGHSSGELGAAYAAGYLSAEDTIRMAYLRGLFLDKARTGAMLAVGTTAEDAKKLCSLPSLRGRICVAAINSPTSVTLSGDPDGIQDAQEIFEDEEKFVRLLRVEQAYHSHHMVPIADMYTKAIRDCGIGVQDRPPDAVYPVWISSVTGEEVERLNLESLQDSYWMDNMVEPVLFSNAVVRALRGHGPFDMAVEVGPHPALRTPASDTIAAASGRAIPYAATLVRGQNDAEAFASSLGTLWQHGFTINLAGLSRHTPKLLKNLPTYAWDHDRTFWHETRRARAERSGHGSNGPHQLLGTRCDDEVDGEIRFRHYLHRRDLLWLADHRIQGQMVLPGSAYICACLEAVIAGFSLPPGEVRLIEMRNIVIRKALVFPEGPEGGEGGVEVLLCIKLVKQDDGHIGATFDFCSSPDGVREGNALTRNCSGEVFVIRDRTGGRPVKKQQDALPPPRQLTLDGIPLSLKPSMFYDWARELGYGYEGCFRGLFDIQRKINASTGRLRGPDESTLVLHPVTLDLAIQSVLLAYCCPGDGRLRSLHMPTRIDLLRIDPAACQAAAEKELSFSSTVASSSELVGNVELHSAGRTVVQMQGLHATPVDRPTAENDAKVFFEMVLEPELPIGSRAAFDLDRFDTEHALGIKAERVAFFYLRRLRELFPPGARDDLLWYHGRLLEYIDSCMEKFTNGTHPYTQPEWMKDTHEQVEEILDQCSSIVDFRLMAAAGDALACSIEDKGETNIWEVLTRDGMLDNYYRHGQCMPEYLSAMTDIVSQLSHRFARMDIIEVGAGTGAATAEILERLDGTFRSFTFTDISSSFFPDATVKFAKHESQMNFRTLDINKPVADQGFVEESYDLVVASLVLHASSDLAWMLANVRRLLRPGGYLVLLELTETDPLRVGLIFGGFSGWWLGNDADGRHLSPCVSIQAWEELMGKSGFSKLDTVVPADHALPAPLSVLVCQAVDQRIQFLRDPLVLHVQELGLACLTVVGGKHLITSQFHKVLSKHYHDVRYVDSLAEIATRDLPASGTVLSLVDAVPDDDSAFQNLTEAEFGAIQKVFRLSKIILWVSRGCLDDRPHSNMFRGLARSAKLEMSDVRVQNLDIGVGDLFEWQVVVRSLLQLEAYSVWNEEGRVADLLWQCEPELFVRDGVVLVPRLKQSAARNNRYNSVRRIITRDVKVRDIPLRIQRDEETFRVQETHVSPGPFAGRIRLIHSLLKPVPVGAYRGFLSVGEHTQTGQHVLVLSRELESFVYASPDWVFPVPRGHDEGRTALLLLQSQLLCQAILRETIPMRQLVVFNPDDMLGEALSEMAKQEGVELLLMTTTLIGYRRGWTHVHPHETRKAVQQMLPSQPFTFVDMSQPGQDPELFRYCLPSSCKKICLADLFDEDANLVFSPVGTRDAADHMRAAYLVCATQASESVDLSSVPQLDLNALTVLPNSSAITKHPDIRAQAIVSWLANDTVRIQVQPASSQILFRPDRTYWLVGLTGGLGPGLCEFMAEKGAAYIALSSRNPRVDPAWISSMSSRGCTIRTFTKQVPTLSQQDSSKLDITDRDSLRALHSEIKLTMPPVAGVAQGAMVLHDAVLPDLSYTRLRETLAPKVDGSIHLDELFSDDSLEFFVFFSSMAYVAGNQGQSAYTAANAFMASLAASRRKRGLVGSVMNMGGIVGEGYITRQLALGKQSALIKAGFDFLSEQAFHQLFSEAVLAGRPGSKDSSDISAGLRVGEIQGVSFANNPIFQHQMARSRAGVTANSVGIRSNAVTKARLLEAETDEEVLNIITDGVLSKLEVALHLKLNKSSSMNLTPDQLGLDSLVAVEFQSWLAKEVGVDLSVTRILNFLSLHDLINTAKEALAPDTLRNFNHLLLSSEDEISEPSQPSSGFLLPGQQTSATTEINSSLDHSSISADTSLLSDDHVTFASTSPAIIPATCTIPSGSKFEPPSVLCDLRFERSVAMSFAQTRFWFLRMAIENQTAFNVITVVRLHGSLDCPRLAQAVTAVGQRHEAIRTAFYADDVTRRPMQGVLPRSLLKLEHERLSEDEEVEKAIEEMRHHNFDLAAGESTRLKLLSRSADFQILVLGYHHIALDGIGNQIFFSDLESAYNGTLDIRGSDILQYPDFTLKQLQDFNHGRWEEHLQYWRGQFVNLPPPLPLLNLSCELKRPDTAEYASYSVKTQLDATLNGRIRDCSSRWGVSPFHFHLAVFRVMLSRYTNFQSDDLCVGVADSNRKDPDILHSLGLFLNLLPLRFRHTKEQSFADILLDVKQTSDGAFTHSRVPFDVLLSELRVPRSLSHAPLFQAFFNYQQNISDARSFCGCDATGELVTGGETGYDISLDIVDSNSRESSLTLAVNSKLYTAGDAHVLQRSYLCLLKEFVANSTAPLALPRLHLEEDINNAINLGRGPELGDSHWPPTVCHRIDDMTAMFRDKVALTDGAARQLTYWQMIRGADDVAEQLEHLDVGRGCFVGLFQMPGPDWICSFLGILRTGACCVPLDRQLGPGRLLLISQDCKPHVILVDSNTRSENDFLQSAGVSVVDVSNIYSNRGEDEMQPNRASATDAAIITYTSGSTGVPKGSLITHASYRNLCEFGPPRWGVGLGSEIVLQQSSYAFDLSIGQILFCLCYGATLVVPPEEKRRDPVAICQLIKQGDITFTIATPTEYFAWLRHDNGRLLPSSKWRTAITAGEAATKPLVQAFTSLTNPGMRLINVYGPSETTIGSADQIILPLPCPSVMIGHEFGLSMLPNYSVRIVDTDFRPVPVGVPGQVLIGGAGVAEGYLNADEHTASAFLRDDRASGLFSAKGWLSVHVSDDCGRLDSKGCLILHGRMRDSTQIKLGGVRMDLRDIENTIVAMSRRIHQAVVSRRVDSRTTAEFLVALVVMVDRGPEGAEGDFDMDHGSFLQRILHDLPLPQIMRPAIAVAVDSLPMTVSNKVDRSGVDNIAISQLVQPVAAHEGSTSSLDDFEESLFLLWEEALPEEVVRIRSIRDRHADFFVAGGNSLSLLTLQSLIQRRLGISIPIMKLFGASTLGQMAATLRDELSWSSTATPENIDWECETAVPPHFAPGSPSSCLQEQTPRSPDSKAVIILTGSTGFLGQKILKDMLLDDTITRIHCIAVRKPLDELPSIFANGKIEVHRGDLRLKQFGLSAHAAAAIFAESSAVVHCGANVSFLESYHTLRHTNLASTRELARLCLPRRVPLHYVSTASVTQLARTTAWGPESVAAFPPSSSRRLNGFGYKATKWASEVFLERVSQTLGLPVVVHRPTSITGEGAHETDLMGSLMRFSKEARAVPDSTSWHGYLDFVDVGTVSRRIMGEVAKSLWNIGETAGGGGCHIRYVYENGDELIGVEDLGNYLEGLIGEPPTVVSFKGWVDALARAGMNPLLVEYLREVNNDAGVWLFPKLFMQN